VKGDGHHWSKAYDSGAFWSCLILNLDEYFKHYYNIILEKLMIEISFQRIHVFGILKWQITHNNGSVG
jgi:hypothetical protein